MPKRKPIPDSILALEPIFGGYVDRSRSPDACWPWLGPVLKSYKKQPYGEFAGIPAHVVARFFVTGEQPGDLNTCHACDNTLCCNPAHLWLGTQKENMADCKAKGRLKGGYAGGKKLTDEQVREVRSSKLSNRQLCEKYRVSVWLVSRIRNGHYRMGLN